MHQFEEQGKADEQTADQSTVNFNLECEQPGSLKTVRRELHRGGGRDWDHTLCRALMLPKQSPWLLVHNPGRVATPTQYTSMLVLVLPTSEG